MTTMHAAAPIREETTGTDQRPARRLHQPLLSFGLVEETTRLRHEPANRTAGRCAKTLVKEADFSVVLLVMQPGAVIREHSVAAEVALQVLGGQVRLAANGQEVGLGERQLVVLDRGVPFRIECSAEASLLLTVARHALPSLGLVSCRDRLEQFLVDHHVPFRETLHRQAYTAQELAAVQHVSGKAVAKVVVVVAGPWLAMAVLRANDRADLGKVAVALDAPEVSLAREDDFAGVFPDCEVGAIPPFGNLYGLPVVVDARLAGDAEVTFPAGAHGVSLTVPFGDYQRVVSPRIADIAAG